MLSVTVCNLSFYEGLEGRIGVTAAGRSARSFCWMFSSDFEIPAENEGPFLTSLASGCRRAGAAPSACCMVSLEVKSFCGGSTCCRWELQHHMPAHKRKLPLKSHLYAVVILRRVREILMPEISLLLA